MVTNLTYATVKPQQLAVSNELVISGWSQALDNLETFMAADNSIEVAGIKIKLFKVADDQFPKPVFGVHLWEGSTWTTIPQTSIISANQTTSQTTGATSSSSSSEKEESRYYTYTLESNEALPDIARVVEMLRTVIGPNRWRKTKDLDAENLHVQPHYALEPTHHSTGGPIAFDAIKIADEKAFLTQDAWTKIGVSDVEQLKDVGDGVTVVVIDTAPNRTPQATASNALTGQMLANNDPKALADRPINRGKVLADVFITMRADSSEDVGVARSGYHSLEELRAASFEENGGINPVAETVAGLSFDSGSDSVPREKLLPYHGLLIASLIRQMAPKASIILVEALNDESVAPGNFVAQAIDYVMKLAEQGVKLANGKTIARDKLIFNLSLGNYNSNPEQIDAMPLLKSMEAACEKGALFVAASGNDSYYLLPYSPREPAAYGYFHYPQSQYAPAAMRQTIAVAAASSKIGVNEYALFSNHGNIAAPGFLVMDTGYETKDWSRYVGWAGTSFATGLVTGSAAVLLTQGATISFDLDHNATDTSVKTLLWKGAVKSDRVGQAPILDLAESLELLRAIKPKDVTLSLKKPKTVAVP